MAELPERDENYDPFEELGKVLQEKGLITAGNVSWRYNGTAWEPLKKVKKRYNDNPIYVDNKTMTKYREVTVTYLESLEDGSRTELTEKLKNKLEITYE